MIKSEAVKIGTVLRDERATRDRSRSWFKVFAVDEKGFGAENVTSRTAKRFTWEECRHLVPARDTPHSELDLTALIGRKVVIELVFGKNTGVITEIVTRSVDVLGVKIEEPVGLSVDGELIRWPEVQSIGWSE